jgi:SAM-dependent methyltransferase
LDKPRTGLLSPLIPARQDFSIVTKLTSEEWHQRFSQQARWTANLREHLYARAGLENARRILEVGCGTGALLSEWVKASPARPEIIIDRSGQKNIPPDLNVHGLDLDRNYLSLARRQAPSAWLVQADAHFMPYAEASFDLLYCHFLLLWVREPRQVLAEMARLLRPGGSLLALAEPDYGGRIDYPPELIELGRQQEEALRRQGAETRLGRRLVSLFHQAGLQDVEIGVLGGQWRGAPSQVEWQVEWAVLQNDLEAFMPCGELDRWRAIDAQAWKRGERVLFVPTFYAWGRKA